MHDDITGLCRDHSFESAVAMCRRCGLEFCEICVVHPFGAKKPYCKECAMTLGGVRSHVTRNALPGRLIKGRVKAFDTFMNTKAAKVPAVEPSEEADAGPFEPAPVEADLQAVAVAAHGVDDSILTNEQSIGFDEAAPPDITADASGGVAPPIDWNQPFG